MFKRSAVCAYTSPHPPSNFVEYGCAGQATYTRRMREPSDTTQEEENSEFSCFTTEHIVRGKPTP